MAIKFEKKIILGSVTSFVVAAIGVVAVFFPDLFNLQKKKVNELNLILENKNDLQTFFNFLNDRKGEFVKLNIGYCVNMEVANLIISDKNSNYYGFENIGENIKQNTKEPIIEWYSPELFAGFASYNNYVEKLESKGLDYPVAINPIQTTYKIKDFLPIMPWIPESERNKNSNYNLNMKNLEKHNKELNYAQAFGGDLLKPETTPNINFVIAGKVFKTEQKIDGAYDGFSVIYIEKGGFGTIFNDDKKLPFEEVIIKESSKNGKDYKWFVGENLATLTNNEMITKLSAVCKETTFPKPAYDEEFQVQRKGKLMGYMSGYFSVSESATPVNLDGDLESLSILGALSYGNVDNGTINSLEIEPINKKEFNLKNY